jgi:hypothetical protein
MIVATAKMLSLLSAAATPGNPVPTPQPNAAALVEDQDWRMRAMLGQNAYKRASESGQIGEICQRWEYAPNKMLLVVRDKAAVPHTMTYLGEEMNIGGATLDHVELNTLTVDGKKGSTIIAPGRLQYEEKSVIGLQPLESNLKVTYEGKTMAIRDLPESKKAEIQSRWFQSSLGHMGETYGQYTMASLGKFGEKSYSNSCVDFSLKDLDQAVGDSRVKFAGDGSFRDKATTRIPLPDFGAAAMPPMLTPPEYEVYGANPMRHMGGLASGWIPEVKIDLTRRTSTPDPGSDLKWVDTADFGGAIERDGFAHGRYSTPDRVVKVPIWEGQTKDTNTFAREAADRARLAQRQNIILDKSSNPEFGESVAGQLRSMGFKVTTAALPDEMSRTVAGRGGDALVVVPMPSSISSPTGTAGGKTRHDFERANSPGGPVGVNGVSMKMKVDDSSFQRDTTGALKEFGKQARQQRPTSGSPGWSAQDQGGAK